MTDLTVGLRTRTDRRGDENGRFSGSSLSIQCRAFSRLTASSMVTSNCGAIA
jgi:hypothetical protein